MGGDGRRKKMRGQGGEAALTRVRRGRTVVTRKFERVPDGWQTRCPRF